MNVKRILEEMAGGDMLPSRLDPTAAYLGGLRLSRVRKTRKRVAALVAVVAVMAALGIVQAMTHDRVTIVPVSPSPIASNASPTASPVTTSPSATPPAGRVSRPSALDCGKATSLVGKALRAQGFGQKMATTCRGARLLTTIDLATYPMRITLTVEVSMHRPSDAAAMSCSGRPGVCEEANSAMLARGDGMLISVRISTGGQGYGASDGTQEGDLRSLVLDLNATF